MRVRHFCFAGFQICVGGTKEELEVVPGIIPSKWTHLEGAWQVAAETSESIRSIITSFNNTERH